VEKSDREAAQHELMGGKLHVYRRENSHYWQCSTYLNGKNHRVSTKEESLSHAKDFAEDWYLELKGKHRAGLLKTGRRFSDAADRFLEEFETITQGERSPRWVKRVKDIVRLHLKPFFKTLPITEADAQAYRIHRIKTGRGRNAPEGEGETTAKPSRSTIHHEIVTLRQILKTAKRFGWINALPDLAPPFKGSGKVTHRGWFSPEEYKQLYEATRRRAKHPPKPRWRWSCEQLHDYVLLVANSGLRPDEASRLEFRDVQIIHDEDTDETILEIEVRGKRGFGYCKSMTGAVRPFERLKARPRPDPKNPGKKKLPEPTDRLFPTFPRELLNTILLEEGLKKDREGNFRSAYSLRHTYVCLRLSDGADIYQIAKNCRTSVEMIQKYYASHIRSVIDASAINVRKPRKSKSPASKPKMAA
jgi:integrase